VQLASLVKFNLFLTRSTLLLFQKKKKMKIIPAQEHDISIQILNGTDNRGSQNLDTDKWFFSVPPTHQIKPIP
jgi:hypothetical protein